MFSQLLQLVDRAVTLAAVAQRVVAFWGPVADIPLALAPFLAVGSLLTLALLTGIAAGSLGILLVVLVALYVLLTEVFGFSIEVGRA